MKGVYRVVLSEWALTAAIALCAAVAFMHSNAYTGIEDRLTARYPAIESWLSLILWGLIFVCGIGLVVLARSSGRFVIVALIFFAPSMLSYDSINILKIVGADFPVETTLTFLQTLVLGVSIITGYMLLNSLQLLTLTRNDLLKRRADAADIEKADSRSQAWLAAMVFSSLVTAVIIVLLAESIEKLLLPRLAEAPWNILLAGLVCIIVLAFYLYWLGLRKKD
jgi:hypothetical protein